MRHRDPTDQQRSKLYKAERAVFESKQTMTLQECREYFVERVLASTHWQNHKGWRRIKIERNPQNRRGWWQPCTKSIHLPDWGCNEWVLIHEAAHALTDRTHPGVQWHGRYFCQHYLELVHELMGPDKGFALAEAMLDTGANFHAPGWLEK